MAFNGVVAQPRQQEQSEESRGAKSESDGVAAKRERLSLLGLALLLKVVETGGGSKAAVGKLARGLSMLTGGAHAV
jgi:hypothetical protein